MILIEAVVILDQDVTAPTHSPTCQLSQHDSLEDQVLEDFILCFNGFFNSVVESSKEVVVQYQAMYSSIEERPFLLLALPSSPNSPNVERVKNQVIDHNSLSFSEKNPRMWPIRPSVIPMMPIHTIAYIHKTTPLFAQLCEKKERGREARPGKKEFHPANQPAPCKCPEKNIHT